LKIRMSTLIRVVFHANTSNSSTDVLLVKFDKNYSGIGIGSAISETVKLEPKVNEMDQSSP
jgi:hypothetical protein